MDIKQIQIMVLTFLLVVGSFFLGSLITKVKYLEQGTALPTINQNAQPNAPVEPTLPPVDRAVLEKLIDGKNISFGKKDSKNIIVEVADPSCPWCHVVGGHNSEIAAQFGKPYTAAGGSYNAPLPEIKKLIDQGEIAFVWIYAKGHNNGDMGTKALYCAHEQDKFWPAHDKLLTNEGYNLLNTVVINNKEKSPELTDFLADVVDPALLKACIDSGKYDTKLNEDVTTAATKLGLTGTPGFYVNTTRFGGAFPWEDMKSALE